MRAEPAIDIMVEAGDWRESLPRAASLGRRAACAALRAARLRTSKAIELSLVLSNDRRVRRLNRAWRGQDKATNVLSFPSGLAAPRGAPLVLGDVVLSLETLRREAREQGKRLDHHFQHLVVHGVLHLAGYDHETDAEAAVMEPLETRILHGLGVGDPYQAQGG